MVDNKGEAFTDVGGTLPNVSQLLPAHNEEEDVPEDGEADDDNEDDVPGSQGDKPNSKGNLCASPSKGKASGTEDGPASKDPSEPWFDFEKALVKWRQTLDGMMEGAKKIFGT